MSALRSLRLQLVVVLTGVVACAMGVVFLYVVPTLRQNLIKDRIASMDWQVRLRRDAFPGDHPETEARKKTLRRMLEEPNPVDTFRTLIEQVIEDALTGGFGAAEMEPTGDPAHPAMLWAVDSARYSGRNAKAG